MDVLFRETVLMKEMLSIWNRKVKKGSFFIVLFIKLNAYQKLRRLIIVDIFSL